jgi:hypothetical protein
MQVAPSSPNPPSKWIEVEVIACKDMFSLPRGHFQAGARRFHQDDRGLFIFKGKTGRSSWSPGISSHSGEDIIKKPISLSSW